MTVDRNYEGREIPYNLLAFNEMYRRASQEFYRTGAWRLVDPDKQPRADVEKKGAKMETKEYRTVDKTAWGPGPWQSEPDKRQWLDEVSGLPCLIVRGPGGALCGYVGVQHSHPAHGKEYSPSKWDDEGNEMELQGADAAIYDISVHGGLTFSSACGHGADESSGICHVPGAGEPDNVWWFGFDCAYAGDYSPAFAGWGSTVQYRTISYVTDECRQLAEALAKMDPI